MTYDQVWWPILGICALHLTHPKCTHSSEHTHTQWTHPEQWAAIYAAEPGEQLGVRSWYWRWRESTYNPCRTWDSNPRPLGYESDALTFRPRLPLYHTIWAIKYKQNACKSFLFIWFFLSEGLINCSIKKDTFFRLYFKMSDFTGLIWSLS